MESIHDPLAHLAPRDVQRQAARMAQDAFAQAFRHTIDSEPEERQQEMARLGTALLNWGKAGSTPEAANLRRAMILGGLDQWGLAFSQIFGVGGMQGLSELVGAIRNGLGTDGLEEACLALVEQINASPTQAFDFKAELRNSIHLALWHSMIAEEDRDSAVDILKQLGGMMLKLLEAMPDTGWMIVANTLADIQIRCLTHGLASEGLGREMTQELFGALGQQMPKDARDKVMASASQAVMAWQQASKTVH